MVMAITFYVWLSWITMTLVNMDYTVYIINNYKWYFRWMAAKETVQAKSMFNSLVLNHMISI